MGSRASASVLTFDLLVVSDGFTVLLTAGSPPAFCWDTDNRIRIFFSTSIEGGEGGGGWTLIHVLVWSWHQSNWGPAAETKHSGLFYEH